MNLGTPIKDYHANYEDQRSLRKVEFLVSHGFKQRGCEQFLWLSWHHMWRVLSEERINTEQEEPKNGESKTMRGWRCISFLLFFFFSSVLPSFLPWNLHVSLFIYLLCSFNQHINPVIPLGFLVIWTNCPFSP